MLTITDYIVFRESSGKKKFLLNLANNKSHYVLFLSLFIHNVNLHIYTGFKETFLKVKSN